MRDVISWSFPIGQMFGILIRVHLIMPLFIIGMIGREAMRKDTIAGSWMDASALMAMVFISVLLHEFGHCFAARYMDGEADEVLLWPLGGLAFCRALPHKPIVHFVVALGGPLVNLILCVIAALLLSFALDQHYQPQFNPIWYPYRENASGAVSLSLWGGPTGLSDNLVAVNLQRFFWVNWVAFLFNVLVVGIPFDGGRMLQAALWPRMGHYQATKAAIYSGFFFMILAVLASMVFTTGMESYLLLLAIFIFMSCAQEWMTLESEREDSLFGYDFSQGYTSLEKDEPKAKEPKKKNFIQRWLAERAARKEQEEMEQREADDKRMDELLDKIQKFGKDSLTDEETRFLKRVSDRYKNK
jgi:stage IV sporulation protein FB